MSKTELDDHAKGHNRTSIERVALPALRRRDGDPRVYPGRDVDLAVNVITKLADGAPLPVFVNEENEILLGGIFVVASQRLGFKSILVTRHVGMTDIEQKHYSVAINQLLTKGEWDPLSLGEWVREFELGIEDFSQAAIGFANGELDKVLGLVGIGIDPDAEDAIPSVNPTPVSSLGMILLAGRHRVMVGSATSEHDMDLLMAGKTSDAAITDPPFGCKIDGFASTKGKHRDFVEGAGEKSRDELAAFFDAFVSLVARHLRKGALFFGFIDWRSMDLLQRACTTVFGPIFQMCCWTKNRAGQGGMYRSQHELVLVFKLPGGPHVNAIQLGRHGRNRSNVWDYPSASSSRSGREGDMLKNHPTPKPVEMIADAMLDCTGHGDRVIDCFLGSGTALIAAERTGRICYGMELDPLYVDVAIRRWQTFTGEAAIDLATGRTFAEIEADLLASSDVQGPGHD